MNIQKVDHPFEVPANEAERLVSVRSLLPSHLTVADELNILTALVRNIFGTAACAVTIIDEDWQRIAAISGLTAQECPREQSVCTQVVQSGEQLIVQDLADHPAFCNRTFVTGEPAFRFYAGFPIEIDEGLTLGALCLLDIKPHQLTDDENAQMQHFARLAGALLRLQKQNIMLLNDQAVLWQNAVTDPLTELYNRRALQQHVTPVLEQLFHNGRHAGMIMLDIDKFKTVNDSCGHPAGDILLKQAAERIRSVLDDDDIPLRIGGDEFCLILPSVQSEQQLQHMAMRLTEAFRRPFNINGQDISSTVSIGTVLAPQDGRIYEDLQLRADKALYSAKARGRNCVVRFTPSML